MAGDVDRAFLEQIKTTFLSDHLPHNVIVFLGVLVLVLAVIIIAALVIRAGRRRAAGREVTRRIDEPLRIERILRQALNRRVRLEIRFRRSEGQAPFISANITDLSAERIELELAGHVVPTTDWRGRQVEAFFRLERQGGRPEFHAFEARILDVRQTPAGYAVLGISLPAQIESRQKRMHLRFELPPDLPHGLVAWPELNDAEGRLSSVPGGWGPPALSLVSERHHTGRLIDVSGGGLKLELPSPVAGSMALPGLARGSRLIIRLDLNEPQSGEMERHFLHAVVQHLLEDFASKRRSVGLRFLSYGRRQAETPDRVFWIRIESYRGVESIDNWVFKRHLELYRDKGLA